MSNMVPMPSPLAPGQGPEDVNHFSDPLSMEKQFDEQSDNGTVQAGDSQQECKQGATGSGEMMMQREGGEGDGRTGEEHEGEGGAGDGGEGKQRDGDGSEDKEHKGKGVGDADEDVGVGFDNVNSLSVSTTQVNQYLGALLCKPFDPARTKRHCMVYMGNDKIHPECRQIPKELRHAMPEDKKNEWVEGADFNAAIALGHLRNPDELLKWAMHRMGGEFMPQLDTWPKKTLPYSEDELAFTMSPPFREVLNEAEKLQAKELETGAELRSHPKLFEKDNALCLDTGGEARHAARKAVRDLSYTSAFTLPADVWPLDGVRVAWDKATGVAMGAAVFEVMPGYPVGYDAPYEPRCFRYAFVSTLVVAGQCQGHALGDKLVKALTTGDLGDPDPDSVLFVRLRCDARNLSALGFYLRHGFRIAPLPSEHYAAKDPHGLFLDHVRAGRSDDDYDAFCKKESMVVYAERVAYEEREGVLPADKSTRDSLKRDYVVGVQRALSAVDVDAWTAPNVKLGEVASRECRLPLGARGEAALWCKVFVEVERVHHPRHGTTLTTALRRVGRDADTSDVVRLGRERTPHAVLGLFLLLGENDGPDARTVRPTDAPGELWATVVPLVEEKADDDGTCVVPPWTGEAADERKRAPLDTTAASAVTLGRAEVRRGEVATFDEIVVERYGAPKGLPDTVDGVRKWPDDMTHEAVSVALESLKLRAKKLARKARAALDGDEARSDDDEASDDETSDDEASDDEARDDKTLDDKTLDDEACRLLEECLLFEPFAREADTIKYHRIRRTKGALDAERYDDYLSPRLRSVTKSVRKRLEDMRRDLMDVSGDTSDDYVTSSDDMDVDAEEEGAVDPMMGTAGLRRDGEGAAGKNDEDDEEVMSACEEEDEEAEEDDEAGGEDEDPEVAHAEEAGSGAREGAPGDALPDADVQLELAGLERLDTSYYVLNNKEFRSAAAAYRATYGWDSQQPPPADAEFPFDLRRDTSARANTHGGKKPVDSSYILVALNHKKARSWKEVVNVHLRLPLGWKIDWSEGAYVDMRTGSKCDTVAEATRVTKQQEGRRAWLVEQRAAWLRDATAKCASKKGSSGAGKKRKGSDEQAAPRSKSTAGETQLPTQITITNAGNPEVNGTFNKTSSLPKDAREKPDKGYPLYQHELISWVFIARFSGTWWIGNYQPATHDFYCSDSPLVNPTAIVTTDWAIVNSKERAAKGKAPPPVMH